MYRLFNFWNAESKMQPITNRGQRGGAVAPLAQQARGAQNTLTKYFTTNEYRSEYDKS